MNRKLLYLFLFTFLVSCKTAPKPFEIYKGFNLPSTKAKNRFYLDSLQHADILKTKILESGKVIGSFTETINSKILYSSVFEKYDKNLVTGYTIYFVNRLENISESNLQQNYTTDDLFSSFSNPEESPIDKEFVIYVTNDLNSKYGNYKETDTTEQLKTYLGTYIDVAVNRKIWLKDGLEIRLRKKTLSDGFLNVSIDYDLSKNYIDKNNSYLQEILSESAKF